MAETGRPPIATDWVDINKGDSLRPNYRRRLVCQETRGRSTNDVEMGDVHEAIHLNRLLRLYPPGAEGGDTGRSVKRSALPEACSSQTTKRGKAVSEPPSNPEPPEEHAVNRVRHFEHHDQLMPAGSTSTPATTTVPSTEATRAVSTQTAITIAWTRIPPAPPLVTQFWALDGIREQQIGKERCVC